MKAGYRSRDLISQLLALGRRQAFELKPLDLNKVVRECSSMLRHALRENIAIDYHLFASPCPVTADSGRMEEVLLNLALNAQDAIPREGRLSIATAEVFLDGALGRRQQDLPPGRYILLTVSDTGGGMDAETVGKIFDPFFTTKDPSRGTGLGLSTVYSIVKQHNGSIEVDKRPGAGSRFMIHLPRGMDLPYDALTSQQEQPGETRRSSSWRTRHRSARFFPATFAPWATRCWRLPTESPPCVFQPSTAAPSTCSSRTWSCRA